MRAQPSNRSSMHSHPTGAALEQDEFVCLSFAVLSWAVPPYSGVESGTFHLELLEQECLLLSVGPLSAVPATRKKGRD